MKLYKVKYLLLLAIAILFNTSCEEDEVATYEIIGKSTDTITDFSASDSEALAGEAVTLTMYYVNISEDPASKIDLYAKVGDGSRSLVTTLNESSASTDAEITRTFEYTVPAGVSDGTAIDLEMELFTQVEFPKLERVTVSVVEQ